ncbi:hypothetical protein FNJ84_19010 [Paracoccus sp. M683]|uniref:hypothetical protein n=1 Tax=Paracoccus sp. M683 TaxID=2594268 RepID=UPI00117ECC51|nr:hypothetical protein [Paracoccus sp. M683]TRW94586.1 hypothetical protein FNJ84_19010 [Paracoccus sp. M683]
MPVLGLTLLAGLGVWFIADKRGEATEMAPLCQGMHADSGFDEALVYIQSAQGYLTGRVDSPDPAPCPESTAGQVLATTDDPAALGKFYDDRIAQRAALSSVEARYAWDVETLFQVNLECAADWDCAQKRISALIAAGLKPSQSLVFCGFDASPAPEGAETEGLAAFRRPQSLPFICDELIRGSGVSEGWIAAYADYFDGR